MDFACVSITKSCLPNNSLRDWSRATCIPYFPFTYQRNWWCSLLDIRVEPLVHNIWIYPIEGIGHNPFPMSPLKVCCCRPTFNIKSFRIPFVMATLFFCFRLEFNKVLVDAYLGGCKASFKLVKGIVKQNPRWPCRSNKEFHIGHDLIEFTTKSI